jgi:hypothetical protein
MTKRAGKREPRPPTPSGLPMTFAEGEEAAIIDQLAHWFDLVSAFTTSEAGQRIVQNDLCRQLHAGKAATLPTAEVIAMADAGHVPAKLSLRSYAATLIDQGRESELLAQTRGYVVKALLEPIVGYPRGYSKTVIDNFGRDIAISVLVDMAVERWPLPTRRAAHFVALVLRKRGMALGAQQVRRIHRDRKTLATRLAAFMTSAV